MVQISVIIPTYNDWGRLSLCLKALENQSLVASEFEVVVVNNLPSDLPPPGFILPDNAVLIHESSSGSYAARNAGIKNSKGEILAFTDSDCIPDQCWLDNAISHFQRSETERIAGKVEIFFRNPEKKSWSELYESLYAFDQKKNVEKYKASITANFFARKSLFHKIGVFNANQMSGEDFGWNFRASSAGYNLIYGEDVKVYHPARAKIGELVEKKRRVFGGKKNFAFKSLRGVLKEIVYLPFIFVIQTIPEIKNVLFSKQLKFKERLKVSAIVLYLFAVIVVEYIRLLFGGKPLR